MNTKIQELIEQCTHTSTSYFEGSGTVTDSYFDKHKFAKLIIQEVISIVELWDEGTLSNADIRTGAIVRDISKYFEIK